MSRITSQTPCPAALDPSHRRISSFELFGDDTTTNIDYTRAIDQPLTGIKPRRRSMLMGPATRKKTTVAPVTIFEDVNEEPEMVFETKKPNVSVARSSTLLGKPPAKRVPGMFGSGIGRGGGVGGHSMNHGGTGSTGTGTGHESRNAPARLQSTIGGINRGFVARPYQPPTRNMMTSRSAQDASTAVSDVPTARLGHGSSNIGSTVRKPPRRQTIFVPEDTTVMSIHPGPRDNTSRIDDSFHLPNLAIQRAQQQSMPCDSQDVSQSAARIIAHAPAARIPHRRQSVFMSAETKSICTHLDPEHLSDGIYDPLHMTNLESQHIEPSQLCQDNSIVKQKPLRRPRQSLLAPPKRLPLRESPSSENMPGWDVAGANTGKENIPPAGHDIIEKESKCLGINEHVSIQARRQSVQPRMRSSLYAPTQASQHRQSAVSITQSQLTTTRQKPPRRSVSFQEPPPEAYDWRPAVARREEEVKKVREFVASKRNEQQTAKLRQYPVLEGELSEPALYEDQWLSYREVALTEVINEIFKATSPTTTIQTSSITEQLINLYNRPETTLVHDRLRASLQHGALASPQSSVGNHQPSRDRGLQQQLLDLWFESYDASLLMAAAQVVSGRQVPYTSTEPHLRKTANREFVKDFFVTIIDYDYTTHSSDDEIDTLRWQKIMLRSLMLVWLLDQSAEARIVDGGRLLNSSSLRKSSTAIIQTLGALMLPACGDIIRALKHLTYEVTYHQDPLDEVHYHIQNIAIDFRDGVFLTRLVETLLYKPDTHKQENDGKQSPSPDMDDLTLACNTPLPNDDATPPRSLSHQLKLPASTPAHRSYNVQIALDALKGSGIAREISADDITNGHREKTLALLWKLIISNNGLDHVVGWNLLIEDIHHAGGTAPPDLIDQEVLLQQWASARSGMEVKNLSTSFTSGKVYEAILRSFVDVEEEAKDDDDGLEALLKGFECFSETFVKSLAGSVGIVVCRATVVCYLAVLAGGLLGLRDNDGKMS